MKTMPHKYTDKDKDNLKQAISFIRQVRNQIETDTAEINKIDEIIYQLEDITGEDE